jgi:hypothetical protein
MLERSQRAPSITLRVWQGCMSNVRSYKQADNGNSLRVFHLPTKTDEGTS